MIVRPGEPADAAAIALVHVVAWEESFRSMLPDEAIDAYPYERRLASWERGLLCRDRCTHVAERDGEIVGFASAWPDSHEPGYDAYLDTLYVLRAAQRGGAARTLLRATAAALLERGLHAMWLITLRESPAPAFYERMGARSIREQPAPAVLGEGVMDAVYGFDLHELVEPVR